MAKEIRPHKLKNKMVIRNIYEMSAYVEKLLIRKAN